MVHINIEWVKQDKQRTIARSDCTTKLDVYTSM